MTDGLTRFDLPHEIAEAEQHKPWPSGIRAKTLDKKPDLRIVLICMETGARLKEHKVEGSSSVQVLRGRIKYTAQGEAHDLAPGSLLAVGASIPHEVEAIEESAFLLTIASTPANAR
jgi:quercetin dioxygenase-like cupin family protein